MDKELRVIIDRFEGKFACVELENGRMLNIPIEIVPKAAKEGDALIIRIDEEYNLLQKQEVEQLFNELINPQ